MIYKTTLYLVVFTIPTTIYGVLKVMKKNIFEICISRLFSSVFRSGMLNLFRQGEILTLPLREFRLDGEKNILLYLGGITL